MFLEHLHCMYFDYDYYDSYHIIIDIVNNIVTQSRDALKVTYKKVTLFSQVKVAANIFVIIICYRYAEFSVIR